ncbi:MAG: GIY-YIG nuclease family protein [Candidatus Omnitrophica bacterium]|nr:GIY-YIG nuclease family protein [Candidatus Omnitrophota bacterium]
MWYVYIIECAGGRLYTGVTTDLARRLKEHQAGKGAKFTRAFGAMKLYYSEACPDHGAALKREALIKKMPRATKLALQML